MELGDIGDISLALRKDIERRAVTAENPTGARGAGGRATNGTGAMAARGLGIGWKLSPSVVVKAGEEFEIASIEGPGVIDHIWITSHNESWRSLLLRMRWDGADAEPAVIAPLGDFFCEGWCTFAPLTSELVVVGSHGGLNSYFPMPFRTAARLSVENVSTEDVVVYYQVDYALRAVPESAGYFHAHWKRNNPVQRGEIHEILDAKGHGAYAGTYLAVGVNGPGWWGEGEVKFFIDADEEFPTICGTGTEDYFGGAWNFDVPDRGYTTFSANYLGMHQYIAPNGLYQAQPRFGMYRWHVRDAINFRERVRVTVQDLGWRSDGRYLQRCDDLASVAYWYSDDARGLGEIIDPDSLEIRSRPNR